MTMSPEKPIKPQVMTGNTPVPSVDDAAPFATRSGATVLRVVRGDQEFCQDVLAEEVPVAMVYNDLSHAVMLSTPDNLADLALGFSLSERILEHPSELYDVEVSAACDGVEVRMDVASRRFMELKERRRSLAGRTGCGLCGVDSLKAVSRVAEPVSRRGEPISTKAVAKALGQMHEGQELHRMTGAVHGVAWVSPDGDVLALREDVGRHNALDKLIGHMARNHIDPTSGFVLTSSRASYEMVQKCAVVGIGMMAAVSAPTALAVRLAKEYNLTLCGFARGSRLVVYSHPDHLIVEHDD